MFPFQLTRNAAQLSVHTAVKRYRHHIISLHLHPRHADGPNMNKREDMMMNWTICDKVSMEARIWMR